MNKDKQQCGLNGASQVLCHYQLLYYCFSTTVSLLLFSTTSSGSNSHILLHLGGQIVTL